MEEKSLHSLSVSRSLTLTHVLLLVSMEIMSTASSSSVPTVFSDWLFRERGGTKDTFRLISIGSCMAASHMFMVPCMSLWESHKQLPACCCIYHVCMKQCSTNLIDWLCKAYLAVGFSLFVIQ